MWKPCPPTDLNQSRAVLPPRWPSGTDSELVQAGRSVPLTADQANDLAAVLTPARQGHPWPDEIDVGCWSKSGTTVPLTKVEPVVVAEVTADAAIQAVPCVTSDYAQTCGRRI